MFYENRAKKVNMVEMSFVWMLVMNHLPMPDINFWKNLISLKALL